MGEWLSDYWPNRFGVNVLDGTSWEIVIEYDNGIPPMNFSGSNSYPYNFDRFQCLFGLSFTEDEDENEEDVEVEDE